LDEQLKVNAPKDTLNPDVVKLLKQFKPDLIKLLKSNLKVASSKIGIENIARENDLLPSFGQAQLWFIDHLDNNQNAYHFTRILNFKGDLNVAALKASFNAIIQRHEILRTTFQEKKGVLYQQVNDTRLIDIPLIDFSELDAKAAVIACEKKQQECAQAVFNLYADSMLRLQLIRISAEHYQLTVVLHHIASDGWSLGILIAEFTTLYHQFLQNEALILPELPIQYADYANWQRTELQSNHFQGLIEYWQKKLIGCSDLHNLALDKPRPLEQSFNGKNHIKTIDSELTLVLKSKAIDVGCTLFTVLESIFSIFISRYSGAGDVIIGTPVANRHDEEVEGLIGYFTNLVPL
jgi:hypothetical protein